MKRKFFVYDGTVIQDYLTKKAFIIKLDGLEISRTRIPLVTDFQDIPKSNVFVEPYIDGDRYCVRVEIDDELIRILDIEEPCVFGIACAVLESHEYNKESYEISADQRYSKISTKTYGKLWMATKSRLEAVWIGSGRKYEGEGLNAVAQIVDGRQTLKTLAENAANMAKAVRESACSVKDLENIKVVQPDSVNHPKHYTSHPSGVECIQITEHYDFCVGNAIKYLWRAGLKSEKGKSDADKQIEDLEKARWYIEREIELLKNGGAK